MTGVDTGPSLDFSTVVIHVKQSDTIRLLLDIDLLLAHKVLDNFCECDRLRIERKLLEVALGRELDLNAIRLHLSVSNYSSLKINNYNKLTTKFNLY